MTNDRASVAVGIVNWNNGSTIIKTIDSVLNQTYKPIEVWVADNCSEDNSLRDLKKYTQVNIIRNKKNKGFAAAQNQIIRKVSTEYYMPLNPDCILSYDYIEKMVDVLCSDKRLGWVSGKLLYAYNNITVKNEKYTPKTNIIYTTGHVIYHSRTIINRGSGENDRGQYDADLIIFGSNGAAPVYKREMLEDLKIGKEYFDEIFFVYGEDEDIDWRANLAGWRCQYVPVAIGYHLGESCGGGKVPWILANILKSRYLIILKNDTLTNIVKDWKEILRLEIKYMIKYWLPHPLLANRVFWEILRNLPETKKKRKLIKNKFQINRDVIYNLFTEKFK